MSKSNNLSDFLTGIADKIRSLTGTSALIDPQDFEDRLKDVFEAGKEQGAEGAAPVMQELSVTPSAAAQVLKPDSGYDGFSEITVGAVTSAIDPDILPENILSGVEILGVTGELVVTENVEPEEIYYTPVIFYCDD